MSMELCSVCGEMVDTDYDQGIYYPHTYSYICEKHLEEDEKGQLIIRDGSNIIEILKEPHYESQRAN